MVEGVEELAEWEGVDPEQDPVEEQEEVLVEEVEELAEWEGVDPEQDPGEIESVRAAVRRHLIRE